MFFKYLLFSVFIFFFLAVPAVAGQVNSFIYHRFDESRYPSTNISSAVFKQQLEYLKNQRIEVISLPEIAARLNAGRPLPQHAAALSVDDAYRSFYSVAMPLLREYRFPVTLFVNTDAVGTPGYLNWSELKALLHEGIVIGNHTASHAYLVEALPDETRDQWRERITGDILKAQDAFERHLGLRPTLFAYPYGEYSNEVEALVRELGFTAAFAQQSGVIHDRHAPFILPRFPMGGPFATLKGFVDKLHMGPLTVREQTPADPVLRENPPVLNIRLDPPYPASGRINCFVQGDNSCRVTEISGDEDGWYRVVAEKPLSGRRNKYTLTLQSGNGDWLWFSQPWIRAEHPPGER